jgi:hypothetical protein
MTKFITLILTAAIAANAYADNPNVTVINPPTRPANVRVASTIPTGANFKTGASGNVAASSAAATLGAVAGRTNYITGFQLTAAGSTVALVVNATVTGLVTGTLTYTFVFPAGVTAQATPLIVNFDNPIPASAVNTAITVTLPSGGAGNTNAAANIQGFDQ